MLRPPSLSWVFYLCSIEPPTYLPTFPRKLSKQNVANFWSSNQGKFCICTDLDLMSPNSAKWPRKFFGFLVLFSWVAVNFWRSNRILTYDFWKGSVPNPPNDQAEQNAACLYNFLTFLRVPAAMCTLCCSLRAIGKLSQAGGLLSLWRKSMDTKRLQQAVKVYVTRITAPAWLPRLPQHCFHSSLQACITLKSRSAHNS